MFVKICSLFLTVFLVMLSASTLWGQKFSENPEEFLNDIRQRLTRNKNPQNEELIKRLTYEWNAGYLSVIEQQLAIRQINKLISAGWQLSPEIRQYLNTLLTIRTPKMKANISSSQFLDVTDSCLKYFSAQQTTQYLKWLENFSPKGIVYQTGIFSWRLIQQNPQLVFKSDEVRVAGKFPALRFDSTTIAFFTTSDSGSIKEAQGFYNLFTRKFYGTKGKYDWARVGLNPNEVYCEFDKFTLDLTIADFSIDTVTLHYKNFLPRPLKGYLQDHLEPIHKPETAAFPLFKSYEGDLKIENFVDRVTYLGGFSLKGQTKVGSKTPTQLATLLMYTPINQLALKVESDEVVLNTKKMVTDNAHMTLYLSKEDSMRHGSMRLLYNVATKDISLSLNRKDKRSQQAILNSYHKLGMHFDEIKWNTSKDTIQFSALVDREHKLFAVESYDYYNEERYRQYRGVLNFNPISLIYIYYRDINDPTITPRKPKKKKVIVRDEWDEYADTVAHDPEPEPEKPEDLPKITILEVDKLLKKYNLLNIKPQFQEALPDLVGFGLISISPNREYITIKEPLIALGKSLTKAKDYDALSIPSLVEEGINAQMSLSSKRLDVYGVEKFGLSDSQFVEIEPTNQKVQIYKNRDFKAGGIVRAGKINLIAKGEDKFSFFYDQFKLTSDSITSLTFSPDRDPNYEINLKKDAKNKFIAQGLKKLKIQDLAGTVYIDKPYSKSGLKTKAYYSMFDCHTPSFVYWSDSAIQKGVYAREKLYYILDPFVIDSLETFNMFALEFMGELNCPDIMPVLRDTLKPVADYTYGLREVIGDTGMPIYHDRGRFYNVLNLDGTGLHGQGRITYRSTEAESDRFTFHFDSVMAIVTNFKVNPGDNEGANYPDMFVSKAKYKWYTKRDELEIQTIDEPILAHGGKTQFWGKLIIGRKGVRASGTMTIEQEQFDSDTILIDETYITMQDGTYRITEKDAKENTHFIGKHITAKRNVMDKNTEFYLVQSSKPNIYFPNQKYITSLSEGTFNTERNEIVVQAMETRKDSNFVQSTDSSQHGLSFPAKIIYYALSEGELNAQGIDSINVADATIKPGGTQQIKILKNGKIEDIEHAEIIASRKNRYHRFYDASVQIKSGIYYTASGKYQYVPINGNEQVIDFYDISVRQDTVTVARTFIEEEQSFFVTDRFYFKDTVDLYADRKFMTFRGQVKIQSSNPTLGESWVKTTLQDANPDSVVVSIKKSSIGNKLIGLVGKSDQQGYYGLFLQNRRHARDFGILQAEGAVTFDRKEKEFKIGELARLKNQKFSGNTVSFKESEDSTTEIITMQGTYEFPDHFRVDDPNQRAYNMEVSGKWKQNNTKKTCQTNMVLKINLPEAINPALEFYNVYLGQTAFAEGDMQLNDRLLLESLSEFFDEDTLETKTKAFKALIETNPAPQAVQFAPVLKSTLTLTGVQFAYCDSAFKPSGLPPGSGYFYSDRAVGWVNCLGKTLNKMVKAKIVWKVGMRTPNGAYQPDHLFIYLELNEGNHIYFDLCDNHLKTTSSNPTYRDKVVAIANKIKKKNKEEHSKLDISLAEEKDFNNFEFLFGPLNLSGCGK